MPTNPEYSFLASSLVKEIATYGGDVASLLPASVHKRLLSRLDERHRPDGERSMTDHTLARADEVLTELVELIETARTLPMSSSCVVPRERTLDLLDALREVLPPELAEARRVVAQRDRTLSEADRLAERAAAAGPGAGRGRRRRRRGAGARSSRRPSSRRGPAWRRPPRGLTSWSKPAGGSRSSWCRRPASTRPR